MNKIRRINLFGGPGSGKSVIANYIRAKLSFSGLNTELVSEVVKDWTFIPRTPISSDSFYLLASQAQLEDIRLRAEVDLTISDSPLLLQYFYAMYHNDPFTPSMLSAALEQEGMYPSINIVLQREDKFYDERGRYEKLDEAKLIDQKMEGMLEDVNVEYVKFSCLEYDKIVDYLISELKEN
jgi:nicotinamide riboside kinase